MKLYKPDQEAINNMLEHKRNVMVDQNIKAEKIECMKWGSNVLYPIKDTERELQFSDSAMGQILNRIKVPKLFYDRCPPALKEDIFNHFNAQREDDTYFVRFNKDKGEEYVRAVLSDKYGVHDDNDLFPILFDVLKDRNDVAYRIFVYDDHITQLALDFVDATGVHNDQKYTAGLVVTNSETGHSSIWVEPVVHTNTCTFYNRRSLSRQGVRCKVVHRGDVNGDRIRPMVEQAKEIAQIGVTQLAEAFTTRVKKDYALSFAKAIDAFPKRYFDILQEEWDKETDIIKAEAARRIILLAQELPLFQRIAVEQDCGKLIGLFDSYKSRFDDLMLEV